jgi:2-oxoglutarate dehydrogenase E1 component
MRPAEGNGNTKSMQPAPASPRAISPSVNGWSAEYLDSEYARFKADPSSVPVDLQAFFQGFDLAMADGAVRGAGVAAGPPSEFQRRVDGLMAAYRGRGHLAAQLDPFGRARPRPPELELAYHGLSEADHQRTILTQVHGLPSTTTLREAIAYLEATYCGTTALEFMHVNNAQEREWFLRKFEAAEGHIPLTRDQKIAVFDQLAQSQTFETFVGVRYGPAYKWFSLEGSTSLIPMVEQMIDHSTTLGVEEIVLGMPHRGRVNVLNSVMGKTFEQVFTEFEDNWEAGYLDGGGDVKYHRGYSITRTMPSGKQVRMAMASNPSHLESVDGVVLGRTRAKQRLRNDTERRRVIPLLMHGDGAVAGQGMVAETLNMSQLEGYTVGGTPHIVVNNLIAFTTLPEDDRSTTYCTDIAKSIEAPVFHVNGEDPEACAAVARLAVEYRQEFRKDIFIDLWCYRKYGHNEGDEQSYTQPQLAALIKNRKTTLAIYTEKLVAEGVMTQAEADAKTDRLKDVLDKAMAKAKASPQMPTIDPGNDRWKGVTGDYTFAPVETAVPMSTISEVCAGLGHVPEGFNLNTKLEKLLQTRTDLPKSNQISHADAELLAVGTLLLDGIPVRLSGQDSRRGTFSQRHAVLRDFETGEPYIPLNNLREMGVPATDHEAGTKGKDGKPRQARFCVYDSPLSEVSVLAFDYGYSLADPRMLVMWEAQFGDFANGAQVMIDQYLASGELKWNRWSGLVLLLPHGYEANGPEHSSCRLERFLLLCADDNMQIVNCSTAAQMFHVLRRQVMRPFRKPLVVASPKRMLRTVTSTVEELTTGAFREMLDDPAFAKDGGGGWDRKGVSRVVLCSGKVYYELAERRKVSGRQDVAIVRIEQLYPFNQQMMSDILARYPKKAEVVYVQEEPRNAGCYLYVADVFRSNFSIELKYIGRDPSATPAVGSKHADLIQQEAVIAAAIGPAPGQTEKKLEGRPAAKEPAKSRDAVPQPAR